MQWELQMREGGEAEGCDAMTDRDAEIERLMNEWDEDEFVRLQAQVQSLATRVDELESTLARMRERESHIRRAVGQLAAAYEVRK